MDFIVAIFRNAWICAGSSLMETFSRRCVTPLHVLCSSLLNKKLPGRGQGVDGCGNFSRMFQKAYTPAETFFRRRKCFAGLRGLFSDGAKGMHAYGNIFRKVKCCSVFPGAKDSVCYVRLMSSSEGRKSRRIHGPPDRRTITWPYSRQTGNLTYCVECCALTF